MDILTLAALIVGTLIVFGLGFLCGHLHGYQQHQLDEIERDRTR